MKRLTICTKMASRSRKRSGRKKSNAAGLPAKNPIPSVIAAMGNGKRKSYTTSLDQQNRIVAKVAELMALCDSLKADFVDARFRQARLADILIDAALEAA